MAKILRLCRRVRCCSADQGSTLLQSWTCYTCIVVLWNGPRSGADMGGSTASGLVGHRGLWEQILWERERSGDSLLIGWVPSHLGMAGNVGVDGRAELGERCTPTITSRC